MAAIETYKIQGESYAKLMSFENWRVAKLNWAPQFDKEGFKTMERHMGTDEVFILYEGQAYLIIGGTGDSPQDISVLKMERGVVYNYPKGAWHHAFCSKDATVLIVENEDVSMENSQTAPVSAEDRQKVLSQIV